MNRFPVTPRTLAATALAILAAACGEQPAARTTHSGDGARTITPQVVIRLSGDTALVTLTLDTRGDTTRIGSYTGRVRFNAKALRFQSEVTQEDGALRAANAQGDSIRVAGISRTGIDPSNLALFRFTVHNAEGLQSLTFDVDELHEISRTDLKPVVRRGQAPRILK